MADEPNQPEHGNDQALRARVESVLESFRPRLRLDGADLVIVSLGPDGALCVRLTGCHACCPVAVATLKSGLEAALHERVPEIKNIVAVR